jgi:hypothetical protein
MRTCRLCPNELTDEDSYEFCDTCGIKIARRYKERLDWEDRQVQLAHDEKRRATEAERARREAASRPPLAESARQEEPVVYYVRLGNHIKIGYSTNLVGRLNALRAEASDVLAIEPGARRLEAQRHEQFKHLRIKTRWENFYPGADLEAHIVEIKATHGIPAWLTPIKTYRRRRNSPVTIRKIDSD